MSGQPKLTLYQQQKITKPKAEDIIPDFIGGDMQKNVLDYVAWLGTNLKMKTSLAETLRIRKEKKTLYPVPCCKTIRRFRKCVILQL